MGVKANARINDWLNDKTRKKGATKRNIEFIRAFRECDDELKNITVIAYFCMYHLGVEDARTMLFSAKRQRVLLYAVVQSLKEYKLEEKDVKIFKKDVEAIYSRVKHVVKILTDDIRLTEYYPYFKHVGFDKLNEFELPTKEELDEKRSSNIDGKRDSILKWLADDADRWNAEHMDEVNAHLERVQPEIDAMNRHREKVKAQTKAERQAERERRKAERAEIKEMKRNAEKYRAEKKRVDKDMEYHYRHCERVYGKSGVRNWEGEF